MTIYRYGEVTFKLDTIEADVWRLTIFPRHDGGLYWVSHAEGSRDDAVRFGRSEIDRVMQLPPKRPLT